MDKLEYLRIVKPDKYKSSSFLFGPRMTGKSSILARIPSAKNYDLLNPELELRLRREPKIFWEEISSLPQGATILLDEVQRVPALLDYVQMAIEKFSQRFIMSGSSARKLKRGAANPLGGRALDLKLHPLCASEIGETFSIDLALHYGTLPRIYQLAAAGAGEEARLILKSYYTTYIKEEIQAEALVRNLGAFQRFLDVAAQAHAGIIEYSNISRDCGVPDNTVKEYFMLLEDTLIGESLWQWSGSERKKSHPKFYFFDCGVVRAIQNRLSDPPLSRELDLLFEGWFIRELIRLRDYHQKDHRFAYWRERDQEIDLLVLNSKGIALAIECKSSASEFSEAPLRSFRKRFPKVPLIVASLKDQSRRTLESGVTILPWKEALEAYLALT